jgi:MYXO-CTERM domain-containing protein
VSLGDVEAMKLNVRHGALAFSFAALAAFVLLWPRAEPLHAFSAQGHTWPNTAGQPVSFRLDPMGAPGIEDDSELAAIRTAFQTWGGVACSFLSFTEEPWAEPRAVQADDMNRIFWARIDGEWDAVQRSTLAFTYTFYRLEDRKIVDADIHVNGVYWQWTTDGAEVTDTRVDVETVLFHEIGHFFGLDHSTDQRAAMFPSNNKGVQRAPANDDIHGICALYPNGEPVPGGGANEGGVGAPCQLNGDCASSLCADDTLIGRKYCTAVCVPGNDACGAGYQCTNTSSGNYCLAPAPVDELCDQCNDGNQCSSGLCTNVEGKNNYQPFCTRACDPSTPGGCPEGYACQAIFREGLTGGVCAPVSGVCNPQGKGGHNERCYANLSCKPGHVCVEYSQGLGEYYCYAECNAPGTACSAQSTRQVCLDVRGRPNIFACFTVARVQEPCNPEICEADAFCLFDETVGSASSLCYRECSTQACDTNEQCVFVSELGFGVCVPNEGFKRDGNGCASDAECISRLCRSYLGASLCTQPCATTDVNACSAGLRCVPDQNSEQGLCWPESFLDPNTTEGMRNVNVGPSERCVCNTTLACDEDCTCDTDCLADGGGCSCDSLDASTSGVTPLAWALLLLALAAVRRAKRRVSLAACRGVGRRGPRP